MFAIKRMRQRAGLTQQEVADSLGIKKARYGDWERETREVNFRDAIRIADLFGCTLEELAGRSSPGAGLSPDEAEVVECYRAADERGRANVRRTARAERGAEGLSAARGLAA